MKEKIFYKLFGKGDKTIVIETALGSTSAEWWHIAEILQDEYQIFVYDRPGYGKSKKYDTPRTPKKIAEELHELLNDLNIQNDLILIGHSQGGLYLQQFARLYQDEVIGIILLDPLTAYDERFKLELSKEVYQGSGVDKTLGLKMGYIFSKLKLAFLFKSMLKKSPPFYYYDDFSEEANTHILKSLVKSRHYKAALEEYQFSHQQEYINHLKDKEGFPNIPLVLICHSPQVSIDEIVKYGGLQEFDARKVENLWQEIMKTYLNFSERSHFIQANNSGHYIHLTETHLIKEALKLISKE